MRYWPVLICLFSLFGGAQLAAEETDKAVGGDMLNEDSEIRRTNASDRLDLGATSIRGNQELPKVLVIVPWKDPGLGDLDGMPVNRLVDEVLAPVDRDVFLRQERYFGQLYDLESAGDVPAPKDP